MYDNIVSLLPKVDLYLYFICDEKEALNRIKKRNRECEQGLDLEFISKLNEKYRLFVSTLDKDKLLIIDTTDGIDEEKLVQLIEEKININFK
jgi:deoxyadenosine/deoxycytidine kinase